MSKISRISFRLSSDLADRIEAEAARQKRTVSDVARLTLDENIPRKETAPTREEN